ncbi:hypothetical protein QBC37DRAFT_430074 [Rhypophila decipiens]|uniref:Uncharacterized protein n=1 Tax=Rhypophila decipiens TaxID=261697 RepID=A0AAN6Y1F3_9PEZI|nr:hypothetical protein QBC37DRAFT_430074 [Rhypophila decipiens]
MSGSEILPLLTYPHHTHIRNSSTSPAQFIPSSSVTYPEQQSWIGWMDWKKRLPMEWLDRFLGINFDGYWSDIECHKEVCEKLHWEGNADLAGVGMVASYIIEMALTTAFVLGVGLLLSARALTTDSAVLDSLFIDPKDTSTKCFSNALQTSVGVFWDTALMFAITIIIAGVTVSWHNSSSYYTMFFASLSSNLATAAVVVVWPLYLPNCRHITYRWAALCVVCMGNAAIATNYWLTGPDSGARAQDIHLSYDWTCLSMRVHHGIQFWPHAVLLVPAFVASLVPITLLAGYILTAILVIQRKIRGLPSPSLDSPVFTTVSIATVFILPGICITMFTLMWVSLAFLIKHRGIVAGVAGPSLQEGYWSFGQILALATWVPTLVDFFAIWKVGLFVALASGLSRLMLILVRPYQDDHIPTSTRNRAFTRYPGQAKDDIQQ